jgi:drug/metabolite transporter (DMT)-like permease
MKRAFFQLHIAILLAGFTGVLGRLITLNEGLLVWYRLFFTTLTFIFISIIFKKIALPDRKGLIHLILIGFIIASHWVLFYGSIKYSNVSVALVCFSAIGFFSSMLEPFILKRKFDAFEIALGLIAILGVYLIFHFDQGFRIGIILGIISSFLAAIFTILNKKMVGQFDPETISFCELGGGWLGLTLVLPFYLFLFPVPNLLPSISDLFWLIILSILCTVLAFNLSIRSLQKISPFTVNLSYNLEPVYGIALAFIIYKEHRIMGASFYMGIFLIFLTVVIQNWRTWRKRAVTV